MVLDGAHAILPGTQRVDVPIAGLLAAASPARLGVIAWEGDAELTDGRVLLGGRALTPEGGDRNPDNAFDSSAAGAIGPALTFGVNVDLFAGVLGAQQTLTLTTDQDAYLVGVVTVTAPMRS